MPGGGGDGSFLGEVARDAAVKSGRKEAGMLSSIGPGGSGSGCDDGGLVDVSAGASASACNNIREKRAKDVPQPNASTTIGTDAVRASSSAASSVTATNLMAATLTFDVLFSSSSNDVLIPCARGESSPMIPRGFEAEKQVQATTSSSS